MQQLNSGAKPNFTEVDLLVYPWNIYRLLEGILHCLLIYLLRLSLRNDSIFVNLLNLFVIDTDS